MKIALDMSPLKKDNLLKHRVRGTGFYLENLRKSLLKYYPENQYTFYTRGENLPEGIDMVHIPYFEPFFLTVPILKKHKTLVTVHDLTPFVFPEHFPSGIKGNLRWQIQKIALRSTVGIITDSESSKNDIINYAGISEDKIHVVYLAAAEEYKIVQSSKFKVQSLRSKYNLPEKFVLYVGDVTWNKNLPRLIEAVKRIKLPLVMVGKALVENNFDKSNPWNQDLIRVQQMIKENKKISCLGFIPTEDLVTIYNIATVFVMPSLYEGFGLPVLEAMSCGCPVVTSETGSLKEIGGDSVCYVDPYNCNSIAEGIQKIYSEDKLRTMLSQRGLERVKYFSWEYTAEKTMQLYKSYNNNLS